MKKLTQKLKTSFRRLFPVIDDQRGTITPEQAMNYVSNRPAWEGDTPFVAVSCEPLKERFEGTVSIYWNVKATHNGELIDWAVWAVPASPDEEASPVADWTGVYGEW